MDYFAGLDISMDETHVCVLDREDMVVRESKTEVDCCRRSPTNWPKRRVVVAEYSRRGGMAADPVSRVEPAWSSQWSASRAGRPTWSAQVARHPQDRSQ